MDRTLYQLTDARVTVLPTRTSTAPVLREAPRNHGELNAFLAERARVDVSRPPAELSLAAQTGSALAVLDAHQQSAGPAPEMPALEVEARARLRDALNCRAGAREAVTAKEAALSNAKAVEHEAILAESRGRLAELDGGDELARRITEWSERGGEQPDLAPDPASLDARHERDRARVKAAAARQAVAAIGEVLAGKRHALAEAETQVQAAARGVIEAVAEDIATEGRKAGAIHRRAELAAHALQRMHGGAGVSVYRLKPETAELAKTFTGFRTNEPTDLLSRATTTWLGFQRALETDADAALG
ncbi:hypothetical protein [Methylobacterium sp. E-066]|uniref:hypothetical protein n=1 Tax=Methylobacterium sp. E-066 TaxID=2836584 RepID=UPI001FB9D6CD|nr:hypothetical protein [Methylobacterium sp. E-066]MCJ2138458.1 hypothetical protein [Methylobacterium sp. E-066]